ncbi:MAG: F0F1 ATP synthase subunit A [Acidimicrobiaceae bacterium]|nr:F0F1 ATP synthase subunit A [Acidimicrobiaceae bacterium]
MDRGAVGRPGPSAGAGQLRAWRSRHRLGRPDGSLGDDGCGLGRLRPPPRYRHRRCAARSPPRLVRAAALRGGPARHPPRSADRRGPPRLGLAGLPRPQALPILEGAFGMSILALEFPPVSHLFDWPTIWLDGTPLAINKTVLIYLAATAATMVLFGLAGRPRESLVPVGVQHVAESGVNFIENSVVMQTIGPDGKKFMPFLTSMFFFILFSNITEVIPFIQFPANSRMAIPITLALLVWVIYNVVGVKSQGVFGYLKNSLFPPGVPKVLYVIVTPIELVSTFVVRPFSLAIRLWANMVAGHLLLVTFAILTATLWDFFYVPAALPFLMLIAMTAFEILVSVLQAFIFTILTAVYIGGSMHPEH